jgi:hypothetical protein
LVVKNLGSGVVLVTPEVRLGMSPYLILIIFVFYRTAMKRKSWEKASASLMTQKRGQLMVGLGQLQLFLTNP